MERGRFDFLQINFLTYKKTGSQSIAKRGNSRGKAESDDVAGGKKGKDRSKFDLKTDREVIFPKNGLVITGPAGS